jgi:hypothetical protein
MRTSGAFALTRSGYPLCMESAMFRTTTNADLSGSPAPPQVLTSERRSNKDDREHEERPAAD